jgi:hypothetical protein
MVKMVSHVVFFGTPNMDKLLVRCGRVWKMDVVVYLVLGVYCVFHAELSYENDSPKVFYLRGIL